MASLDSVRLKINHSELHLNLLKAEIKRYLDANPGNFMPHPDSSHDRPIFTLKAKVAVPPRLSLIVGDCLQNLRSSLDYLVTELVLVSGNEPSKQNSFPICLTSKSFEDARRGHRIEGMSADAAALIEAFQPYHDGEPCKTSLAILDNLTNVNKHRRLLLAELNSFSIMETIATLEMWMAAGTPDLFMLAHDTDPGRPITPEQMEMQGDLIPFIAFNERAIQGMEVGIMIDAVTMYVNALIDRFSCFFD